MGDTAYVAFAVEPAETVEVDCVAAAHTASEITSGALQSLAAVGNRVARAALVSLHNAFFTALQWSLTTHVTELIGVRLLRIAQPTQRV